MTVRQLIDALMNLPPDLPVLFKDPVMTYREVTGVRRELIAGQADRPIATLTGRKAQ